MESGRCYLIKVGVAVEASFAEQRGHPGDLIEEPAVFRALVIRRVDQCFGVSMTAVANVAFAVFASERSSPPLNSCKSLTNTSR